MKYDAASIGRNIWIIDKYFKAFIKQSLKAHDLNTAEAMVLLALFEVKAKDLALNQEQLITTLHYDKGVMARTMKSLEGKSLVLRHSNPKDNRSSVFTIAPAGETHIPGVIMALKGWNEALLSGIEDLDLLTSMISKLASNAKQTIKGDIDGED